MNEALFDELVKWGNAGHASSLHYGLTYHDREWRSGWLCLIHSFSQGSVSYEDTRLLPSGFHPTSIYEATRQALQQATACWPEMARRLTE